MAMIRYSPNEPNGLPEHSPRYGNGAVQEPAPYVEPTPYVRMSAPDAGGFGQYWAMILRRKGTLIATSVIGGLAGVLISMATTPMYRADTSVEVQNLNEEFLNMKSVTPTSPMQSFQSPEYNIRTQTTVLQSKPVVQRALSKLNLEKRIVEMRQANPGLTEQAMGTLLKTEPAPSRDNRSQRSYCSRPNGSA